MHQIDRSNPNFRHGWSGTKLYMCWKRLKVRCNNKNSTNYHRWGGRGITYDPKWEKFEGFLKDMEYKWLCAKRKYKNEALSIDRINNDGDYCKKNCRFIPRRMNRPHTRKFNGAKSKPVWQCDRTTKKKIKRFPSSMEVQRHKITSATEVTAVCKMRRRSAGGYFWEYD